MQLVMATHLYMLISHKIDKQDFSFDIIIIIALKGIEVITVWDF